MSSTSIITKYQRAKGTKRTRTEEKEPAAGSEAKVIQAGLDPKIVKALKQLINKSIDSKVETKQGFVTLTPTDFNSGISGVGDVLRVIPNMTQGPDGHNRLGDVIEPQSINLRMIVQMLPQGANATYYDRKIAVRLMLITPKQFPNWAAASAGTATWMPQLLKKGGVTGGFTGDISDLYAPYNVEAITCHWQKVLYFNQNAFPNGTLNTTLDQSHLVKFVNKTIKLKGKKWHYSADVDSGLTPVDAGYFLVLGYCFVDGTAPDTLSTRIRFQYDSVLNYQDA